MEQTKRYPEFSTNEYAHLQRIIKELKEVLERDGKRHEMDQDLTPSMRALLEDEIIPVLENELDYDPTPQYLYDNTDGEPPVTAAETHHAAWVQHQELHR
jgi:hypothetical protein